MTRASEDQQRKRITSSAPVIGYFTLMAAVFIVIVLELVPFQVVEEGTAGGYLALSAAASACAGILLQTWRFVSRSSEVMPDIVRVRGFWRTRDVPVGCLTEIKTTEYRAAGGWFQWSWVVLGLELKGEPKTVVVSANRRARTSKHKAALLRTWLGGDASGLELKHDPSPL